MVIKLLTEMDPKWSPCIALTYMCLTCGRMIYSLHWDVFIYEPELYAGKEINRGNVQSESESETIAEEVRG